MFLIYGERGCRLELFMHGCFERNGSAQNGFKRSCKREAYPFLRGEVPYRTVPKSCVNAALVVVVVLKSAKDQLGMVVPTQNDSLPAQLLVAYSVNQAEDKQVSLRITNTYNCDITLQAGQQIGEYCPLLEILLTPLSNSQKIWNRLGNFILNFATLSAPLVQLTKKGSKFL